VTDYKGIQIQCCCFVNFRHGISVFANSSCGIAVLGALNMSLLHKKWPKCDTACFISVYTRLKTYGRLQNNNHSKARYRKWFRLFWMSWYPCQFYLWDKKSNNYVFYHLQRLYLSVTGHDNCYLLFLLHLVFLSLSIILLLAVKLVLNF